METSMIEVKDDSFIFEFCILKTISMVECKEPVESAEIQALNFKWKIVLLPKQLRNTVGVFLQLINPSRDVECIINFWNVKPSNESLKNFKIRHTYKDCVDMGCKDFIIVSIVNNTLTIGCKVTILNGIKLTASRTLANDFENLFLSNNFSDLVISVDKRQIPAHKIILSVRSNVFAAMFEHRMKENVSNILKIDDFSYDVVLEMLRFIYTDLANLKDCAGELLKAADKYNLEVLKQKCEDHLLEGLTVPTAVHCLVSAELHNCTKLKKAAAKFVKTNFKEIIKRDEWKLLVKNNPILLDNILVVVMES